MSRELNGVDKKALSISGEKANPEVTTARAKVLRWDFAPHYQKTACGKVEPHE